MIAQTGALTMENKDTQAAEVKKKEVASDETPPQYPLIGALKAFVMEVGAISKFAFQYFRELVKPPYEFRELVKQMHLTGYKSLALVGITGFIMGLVLTIQSRPVMAEFGAEAWIPGMIAVSIVREIGPVITALICAGKVGSGMGAELGSMKVTEQIDAMEVSGTNPFKYLVVTRVLATTLMVPILVVFSDTIALFGSYIGVNLEGKVSLTLFFTKAFESLDFSDVLPAFIKCFFFGFIIGLIGCYKGYNSNKGTEGVGQASNSAVVIASLMVFIIDMIAVQLTTLFT
jgi:phospholipid/cholesterol/gamma-HCH transport system permease protein